MLGCL